MDFSLEKIQESAVAIRDNVDEIEKILLEEEQVDCPVYHHFHPGIYMREVHIKAGTFAIGHMQKTTHSNIFYKGEAEFVLEDGSVELWKAPMMFVSGPGRKIALIKKDMVWFNMYPTTETDIETLEKTYLDKSDYFESLNHSEPDKIAINDFYKMLNDCGYTEQELAELSEIDDLTDYIAPVHSVGVFNSNIHGKGVFTMAPVKKDSIIISCNINGKRTQAGRYLNHSATPNARIEKTGNIHNLVALRNIEGCHGGHMGEEITIDYREL